MYVFASYANSVPQLAQNLRRNESILFFSMVSRFALTPPALFVQSVGREQSTALRIANRIRNFTIKRAAALPEYVTVPSELSTTITRIQTFSDYTTR